MDAERWARIRAWVVPALVFWALVLVMGWRLWTPLGDRREFGIDSQWAYWGELKFQLDAYRHGELPLWNPFDRAGYPFYSDPQGAILYPVTWVLLVLGWATRGAGYWLIDFENLFHLWLAATGMYAYLRRRGVAPAACYVGGLVLVLSSPFIHHIDLNLNWSMAWAPWALLAVDFWALRPTAARAAGLAAALAMAFLAGAMPTFWYTALVVVPYAIWALVYQTLLRSGAERRAYRRAALVSGTVGAGLFVAMVAAQMVATAGLVPRTVRADRDLAFVVGTQFTAVDLVGFLVPRLTRLNHYLGAGAVLWIGCALVLRPAGRTLVLGAVALAGILCAWGLDGGLLPVAASLVPPFRLFRYAMRYVYVSMVPLGILAAEGLDALASLVPAQRARRVGLALAAAGCLLATVFAVGFVVNTDKNLRYAYAMAFVAFPLAAWASCLVASRAGTPAPTRFMRLAAVLLAVDLLSGHMEAIERNMAPLVATPHDGEVDGLAGVRELEYRVFDRSYLKFRPGIRLGIRDLGGYEGDPLALSRYAALRDALEARPRLLGHANVRWLLEADNKVLPKSPADAAALKPLRPGVFEVPDPAPAIVWVGRPTLVPDERSALAALLAAKPGTVAVVERGGLGGEAPPADTAGADVPAVAGRWMSFARNRVVASIDAPSAGVVVVHEAFDPGWTATVDGAPARLFPANVMFRGLWVGPGHHTIEMRFHAAGFLALAALELVALVAAGVLLARGRRARGETAQ
jgi:hypothetical protein